MKLALIITFITLGLWIVDDIIVTKQRNTCDILISKQESLINILTTNDSLHKVYEGLLEPLTKHQAVDLPEEYQAMSHNSNKPDTLLGFYDNDTVYITFTGKHK